MRRRLGFAPALALLLMVIVPGPGRAAPILEVCKASGTLRAVAIGSLYQWDLGVGGKCLGIVGGLADISASGVSHPPFCSPSGGCFVPAQSPTIDPIYGTFRVDVTLRGQQFRLVWSLQKLLNAAARRLPGVYLQTIRDYPTCNGNPCMGFSPGDFRGAGVLLPGPAQPDSTGFHWKVTFVFTLGPPLRI